MTHYFYTPHDSNVLNELRSIIYQGRCILVTGTRLSAQTSAENGVFPSSWRDVLNEMVQWSFKGGIVDKEILEDIRLLISEGFLLDAGQELEEQLLKNQQLHHCLREIFVCNNEQISEIHRLLATIPFRTYLTTSYDNFIETAYFIVKQKFLKKFYESSIQNALIEYRERSEVPFIIKLHGDLENIDSLRFGDRSFNRFLSHDSTYWMILENLLATSSVLFIGFDKFDHDLEGFLNKMRVFNSSYKHWMLISDTHFPALKAKRLRQDKGIRLIQYRDDASHSELMQFLKSLAIPPAIGRRSLIEGIRSNTIETITETTINRKLSIHLSSEGQELHSIRSPQKVMRVFYSFAQADDKLCQKLEQTLIVMRWQKIITDWHSLKVSAGEEWEREINIQLQTADIILLLISPDFFTEAIYQSQISQAIQRHNRGDARVIPIILRPTFGWEDVSFDGFRLGQLQILPRESEPVTRWDDKDEAFKAIAEGIKEAIKQLTANSKQKSSL